MNTTRDAQNGWVNTPPTEEGKYLFYGDPFFGNNGVDYTEEAKVECTIYFVDVHKTKTGLVAITKGTFMRLYPFDGIHDGYVGLWKRFNVELPSKEDMTNVTNLPLDMR